MTCKECRRKLRPTWTTLAEHPGTIKEYSTGYCCTCYRKVKPPRQKHKRPDACVSCDRKLRPCGTAAKEYPGTMLHKAGGLCKSCHNREKAGQELTLAAEPEPELVVEASHTLTALSRGRAERKARAERLERAKQLRIQQERVRAQFLARRAA